MWSQASPNLRWEGHGLLPHPVVTPMLVLTDENRTFQKRPVHGMISHERYKMADGHIAFVSFFLGFYQA